MDVVQGVANRLVGEEYGSTLVYILVCALCAVVTEYALFRAPKLRIPRVGKDPNGLFALAKARADFFVNGRHLSEEGYSKYKDSAYVVQTGDMERIILSSKYADELRAVPQDQLSSVDAQCDRHLASWNTLDVVKRSSLHADICRVQLNQNLGRMMNGLREEVIHAVGTELATCNTKEYLYLPMHALSMKVVSRVVNRALVGYPLCRNEEWFKTSMGYTIDAFTISGTLRPRSRLVRPFVFHFMPARTSIQKHINKATELLVPVIEERTPKDSSHADAVQWMLDSAIGKDRDPREITLKILFLCLASISSSTMGVSHAMYDLCAFPEYVKPLREEITAMIAEEGGWTLAAMHKMKKLDSFVKESQRINHPGIFSFNRKILKTIKLSDGTVLPKGNFISMPTYSIARDPEFYDSPLEFQPWRFYELRQRSEADAHRHQLTSTGPTNLAFGYGNAACPGRAFAAVEMKTILAHFIMNYDFSFPDGQTERPDNVFVDERITPSSTQKVGFRLRNDV